MELDYDAIIDTSLSEDTDLSEASVLKEASELLRDNGLRMTESELQEFKVQVTKRRILRGSDKTKARLYRIRNKASRKLSQRKWKRTAGAKRLKRMWARLRKKPGILAALKKRFGNRTMVRLVQSLEEPENGGQLFGEATVAQLTDDQVERVTAALLTAEVLAIAGTRFAEAQQFAHAEEIAANAEAALKLAETYEADKGDAAFDAMFPSLSAFNVQVQRALDSDEFWDTYAEHGPLSALEGLYETEAA